MNITNCGNCQNQGRIESTCGINCYCCDEHLIRPEAHLLPTMPVVYTIGLSQNEMNELFQAHIVPISIETFGGTLPENTNEMAILLEKASCVYTNRALTSDEQRLIIRRGCQVFNLNDQTVWPNHESINTIVVDIKDELDCVSCNPYHVSVFNDDYTIILSIEFENKCYNNNIFSNYQKDGCPTEEINWLINYVDIFNN